MQIFSDLTYLLKKGAHFSYYDKNERFLSKISVFIYVLLNNLITFSLIYIYVNYYSTNGLCIYDYIGCVLLSITYVVACYFILNLLFKEGNPVFITGILISLFYMPVAMFIAIQVDHYGILIMVYYGNLILGYLTNNLIVYGYVRSIMYLLGIIVLLMQPIYSYMIVYFLFINNVIKNY